jgi:predicted nuclease of restriction endonuclease-like RecB superfamily
MRLALSDVKKHFSHRGGEVYVIPHLLRPRELLLELDALIALHESFVGLSRSAFPEDRPAELIGDYRLARCLVTCLGEWYEWGAPAWPDGASEAEAAVLAQQGLDSPSALRLALYDFVNASYSGYLPSIGRELALNAFAASVSLDRATLDTLLDLDAGRHTVLARVVSAVPTATELARRYNQRAVEAMLSSASTVEWVLLPETAHGSGGGLGTVVKQVCFLARRLGVQYEVAFDAPDMLSTSLAGLQEDRPSRARAAEAPAPYSVRPPSVGSPTPAQPETLDRARWPVVITLYGPQEVTGAPTQYGERLAHLCRVLLGYRRPADEGGHGVLAGSGLTGQACVYIQGRPMRFPMDERLLRLLRLLRDSTGDEQWDAGADGGPVLFDSSLEQRLHEEFSALERRGETTGWHLEREPEPLLVEDTIAIPDFALARGGRRVYLEIAGYWRPEYRERKARKLAKLRGAVPLILAAPESARAAFESLGADLPLLWYRDRVRAHALLSLLDRAFDDAPQRLAALDPVAVGREVAWRGCIPPAETMALLRCYTRAEVARALDVLARGTGDAAPPVWIDGLGLCSTAWRDALLAWLREQVAGAEGGGVALSELCQRVQAHAPALAAIDEQAVEVLARLAGMRVTRASIFEAVVTAGAEPAPIPAAPAAPAHRVRRAQPRKAAGRTHSETTTETRPLFFADERETGADAPPGRRARPTP